MTTNNSINTTNPIGIANGGSNASSFGTSNGIVVYNGTSLVNYSGPQLSSGGVMTNLTQPSFLFYQGAPTTLDVTGDGTAYTIGSAVALTSLLNRGSAMTTGGTFTAPITGVYMLGMTVRWANVGTSTTFQCNIITSAGNFPGPGSAIVSTTALTISYSVLVPLNATGTVTFTATAAGGTKTVGLDGNSAPITNTVWGYLVC